MPNSNISELRLKVLIDRNVPWWWRFAYLIPNIFERHHGIEDDFAKVIQGHDKEFIQYVQKNVQTYIDKGTLPDAAIVGPIVNIAEDVMAGREPIIRAGDYIAIQNHIRAR